MSKIIESIYSKLLKQQCVFEVNDNKVVKRAFRGDKCPSNNCHLFENEIVVFYGGDLAGYFDNIIGMEQNGELTLKYQKHGERYVTTCGGWFIYVYTYGKRIFIDMESAEKALLATSV